MTKPSSKSMTGIAFGWFVAFVAAYNITVLLWILMVVL